VVPWPEVNVSDEGIGACVEISIEGPLAHETLRNIGRSLPSLASMIVSISSLTSFGMLS